MLLVAPLAGCGERNVTVDGPPVAALVGVEPVPAVHLFENHSTALVAWRGANARDRIAVHLDGHSDFDWLPDATVARIAAAAPREMANLELHPYALDGSTHSRFGIWNWLYAAARLGMIRELVWVVPGGTLADRASVSALVQDLILAKIQMVTPEEAHGIRAEGRSIRGTLLGVPLTICELPDLPKFDEPVLLDIDLDFFTTRSAASQEVTSSPWVGPDEVIETLVRKGIRSELVTLSYSTLGGYLPPGSRWIGPALQERLKRPAARRSGSDAAWLAAEQAGEGADPAPAVSAFRALTVSHSDEPAAWYGLARALEAQGQGPEAAAARRRAAELDPVLEHEDLFEGDALWWNRKWEAALDRYQVYWKTKPESPFATFALRRIGGCLAHLHRDEEAIEAYRSVLARAPDHADTRMDLALLLRARGDLDGAVRELREARRILPDRSLYAMALGTTLAMGGALPEAATELLAALERQPCLVPARAKLAAVLLEMGRSAEAGHQARTALEFDPGNPQLRQIAARLGRRSVEGTPVSRDP